MTYLSRGRDAARGLEETQEPGRKGEPLNGAGSWDVGCGAGTPNVPDPVIQMQPSGGEPLTERGYDIMARRVAL